MFILPFHFFFLSCVTVERVYVPSSSGHSVGSSGSQERSLDSDSDVEELGRARAQRPPLVSQESETSTEEEQTSPRASLDLSALVPETIPEQTAGTGDNDSEQVSDQ